MEPSPWTLNNLLVEIKSGMPVDQNIYPAKIIQALLIYGYLEKMKIRC